jgi:hypothetical protein
MHKQLSSLLSNGGSARKLAEYTRFLAKSGVNIRAIGGAEWDGKGAVAVLLDDSANEAEIAETLAAEGFPTVPIHAAEAVLPDIPGSLATAAELIDDLDILTILVPDTHGKVALVSFGFATEDEATEARKRLGDFAVRPHALTKAWKAHEKWDRANPTPKPDPKHPGRHAKRGRKH